MTPSSTASVLYGCAVIAALCIVASIPKPVVALSSGTATKREYDLVVVGGGSAGLTAAKFARTFSKSAVIIEAERMGGDCTWYGCVPSKSIIAAAKAAHAARTASARFGVDASVSDKIDMKKVMATVRAKMDHIYEEDDSPAAMTKLGIDTMSGKATLVSPKEVVVGDITVVAKEGIVLATGAKPRKPTGIEGLDSVPYMTYEDVWNLETLPASMTIVGGGPVRVFPLRQ